MLGIGKLKQEIKELSLKYDIIEKIISFAIMNKSQGTMQKELIVPLLQEKWAKQNEEKGIKTDERIKTLGQQLISLRKELHDDMLLKNRNGLNTEKLEGKIAILNLVIGDELYEKK